MVEKHDNLASGAKIWTSDEELDDKLEETDFNQEIPTTSQNFGQNGFRVVRLSITQIE